MAQTRVKTKVQGVRYREHASRKHGLQLDRYFFIRFRVDGKEKEEGLGWASEGWTIAKAADTLAELKMNARTGTGEKTLNEKREAAEAAKQAVLDRQRAEQEAAEIEKKVNIPLSVIFKDQYLTHAKDNKKTRSVETEEHLFKNWIEPVVGKKPLKDISAFDCERIKKRMRTKEKSDRTIEYTLAVLRQVFTWARKFKVYLGPNPLLEVDKPKYDNRKQRFLTREETELLMAKLKNRNLQMYQMAMTSLHTGLRAGEIFALTWGDMDFDRGLILLRDTKNTETRYGFLTEALKQELMTLTPGKPSELVFKDKTGAKIKSISATWDRLVDDLGLNTGVEDRRMKFTFHGLRHSFASNLVAIGVDLFRVQQLLGHKTPKMTLRYSHMRPDDLREAISQMEAAMNQTKTAEVILISGMG
ncbi:MAG: tyrosine-type recombinase/integrase [Pseudomonadota bacterium]